MLDVDACLPFEQIEPVVAAGTAAHFPATAPDHSLLTLEGIVTRDRSGSAWPMLDGAVILYGAPCGVGFVCSSNSCAPIALSRHVLVTGWYFRHRVCDGMVPMRNGRPDLQVVSWQELPEPAFRRSGVAAVCIAHA